MTNAFHGGRFRSVRNEKANILNQIESEQKYKEYRKTSDEAMLMLKAFVDSGFTRSESMRILLSISTEALKHSHLHKPF